MLEMRRKYIVTTQFSGHTRENQFVRTEKVVINSWVRDRRVILRESQSAMQQCFREE